MDRSCMLHATCRPAAMGLDMGTSSTCAAVFQKGRLTFIKDKFGDDIVIPTCILFTHDKENDGTAVLAGGMAQNLGELNYEDLVFGMKKLIGKTINDPVMLSDTHLHPFKVIADRNKQVAIKVKGEGTYSPEEVCTMFLTEMKQNAERTLGTEVDSVVVTVPSSYGFMQRQKIREGCVNAGLNVLQFVDEATAASLAYVRANPSAKQQQLVLVVNIGAAFMSVSLVNIEYGRMYKVKAVAGNPNLGGDSFDARVRNAMVKEVKHITGIEVTKDKTLMKQLRKDAVALKEALSESKRAEVNIQTTGREGIVFSLTRTEFEEMNEDLFKAILEPIQTVLQEAEVSRVDVDRVVLVGGCTRIPKIQKKVSIFLNNKSLTFSFSDCLTLPASGAAILAANLQGYEDQFIGDLVQVAPYSIGVETAGENMTNLIDKNTEIPKRQTKSFSTLIDYQEKALITVYEGDQPQVKDNDYLGQLLLKNVRREPQGFPKFDVEFEIDRDCNICVSVTVASSRQTLSLNVSLETLVSKPVQDRKKCMAIVCRMPHGESCHEISNDWEDINTDPALKDLVAEDQLVQNIRSEKSSFPKSLDSGLAFKPLLQRHSKTSVQSLAEPFHRRFIRSGLHSRRFSANDELQKNFQSDYEQAEQHQNNLQHALLEANSIARSHGIQAGEAISRAEIAEIRAIKLRRERDHALDRAQQFENDIRELTERQEDLHLKLANESELANVYWTQYNIVCGLLKDAQEEVQKAKQGADYTEGSRQARTLEPDVERTSECGQQSRQSSDQINSEELWVLQRDEIRLTGKELGRGGWGTVEKALFRGTYVAAKRMYRHIISDYNRHLFEREMNIGSRLRHPNLVQFIGATAQGEPIILTELMTTSVWDELQLRPFTQPQIFSIGLDVAKALNYLHLMHPDPVLHRDVSSANILLNPGPNDTWIAKLSDYGSVNYVRNAITRGPGNAAYSPPESEQSPKMDVYSYGILLLEICTRKAPDSSVTDRNTRIQTIEPVNVGNLVRMCTSHEPALRPTMAMVIDHLIFFETL